MTRDEPATRARSPTHRRRAPSRRRWRADPRGRPPRQALPDQGGDPLRPRDRRACRRSTTSRSRSTRGETLGLVGESGCGKSTLSRSILQLIEPTSGSVSFEGQRDHRPRDRELRALRPRDADDLPGPLRVAEPAQAGRADRRRPDAPARDRPATSVRHGGPGAARAVGLNPEHYNRYPHEFSGGQRQRIGIARALSLKPKLIIADEPVSALDVSIQAQIINLLEDLQDEFDLTYVFVAHDLGVVRHVADRIAVMYLGKIVEIGPADEVYARPDPPVHASRCSRRCRSPTRARTPRASRSCSRATCRARRTRRRPAASTPAARRRPRSARRSSRRWSTTAAATGPPATTRSTGREPAAVGSREQRALCSSTSVVDGI